jgi:hypothetical protein
VKVFSNIEQYYMKSYRDGKKLSNMSDLLDEKFEEYPIGLKIVVVILFLLPIPLIYLALRDLFIKLIFDRADDQRWMTGAMIILFIALMCYGTALGLARSKSWAPTITIIELILSIIAVVMFIIIDPEFFTFREIGNPVLYGLIGALVLAVLIVSKNRKLFT